ncbi:PHB depolymerase family esterase [Blastomonas sp.]|uniref:extracellular catalytic domain type 1 short-chain-length polyhydroxyalkanoate depolymerase n=1 Tax=Blastomonas sp. TaxID=1909299 RepID=UPI0026234D65|nr:PHB depolymerase family esterase [Blastomonas sp.]MDM7956991.1 PHB depolymerase family esterase [Blastomonas sp.]
MAKALRLTRAGNLGAATRLIQATLNPAAGNPLVSGKAFRNMHALTSMDALQRYLPSAPVKAPTPKAKTPSKPKRSTKALTAARTTTADRASSFTERSFSGPTGTLAYWLYLPSRPTSGLPVVIMLHGCTQTPKDFASGTQMNLLAEELGFIVAYPEQPASANMSRCWNWFKPGDQRRDSGEPAKIAALTREIVAEHAADPSRVYVAGLSAGGAAAAILGAAYPDVYAAIGVHSGLACGAATSVASAFTAMRSGSAQTHGCGHKGQFVPVITFHGDKDGTVNPVNSAQIVANAVDAIGMPLASTRQQGGTAQGRAYTRDINCSDDGKAQIEQWTIHGASHAWSGGHASGTYTDAQGPDASRAMATFFLQHSLPKSTGG